MQQWVYSSVNLGCNYPYLNRSIAVKSNVSIISCKMVNSFDPDQTAQQNQLLQLCTARTAWSNSVIKLASVIKLVLILFGKCTTLLVMKC